MQARTRAIAVSNSDRQGETAEGARGQPNKFLTEEAGSDGAAKSAASISAAEDVRWDERLILELPLEADKEEVRPSSTHFECTNCAQNV